MIDYSVDYKKLTFYITPLYSAGLPTQCPSVHHEPIRKRFSLWTRFLMRLFGTTPTSREIELANRCQLYDGHWDDPEQREHRNSYDERWPISESDTLRLNP